MTHQKQNTYEGDGFVKVFEFFIVETSEKGVTFDDELSTERPQKDGGAFKGGFHFETEPRQLNLFWSIWKFLPKKINISSILFL